MTTDLRALVVAAAEGEVGNRDASRYWTQVLSPRGPWPRHWCGAFALWCLAQVGVCEWPWRVGQGFLFRLPLMRGHPQPGDIAYRDQPYQHHAVVSHVTASRIGSMVHTIDGNAGVPPEVRRAEHQFARGWVYYSIQGLIETGEAA